MTQPRRQSGVDGPVARVIAFLLIAACVATLAYMHREALFFTAENSAAAGNPELAACLAERIGAVDKMQADGVVNQGQYDAFRDRAEAFCQQQFGNNSGPPGALR